MTRAAQGPVKGQPRSGARAVENESGPEELDRDGVTVECVCGRPVETQALEGYPLPTFVGACPCGRVWSLTELSAQRIEPEE